MKSDSSLLSELASISIGSVTFDDVDWSPSVSCSSLFFLRLCGVTPSK